MRAAGGMLPISSPHCVCACADLLLAPMCYRHHLSLRPQDDQYLRHHHGPSTSSSAAPQLCGSSVGQPECQPGVSRRARIARTSVVGRLSDKHPMSVSCGPAERQRSVSGASADGCLSMDEDECTGGVDIFVFVCLPPRAMSEPWAHLRVIMWIVFIVPC